MVIKIMSTFKVFIIYISHIIKCSLKIFAPMLKSLEVVVVVVLEDL